jgi:DNA-binding LacI/PurR family transcriptional regulator
MSPFETITKFRQVADHIEKEIADGKYPPGTKLPSERDLAKEHSISHMTINKAIATLEAREVVKRVHGNGTFTLEPRVKVSSKTIGAIIDTEKILHAPFAFLLPRHLQRSGYFTAVFDVSEGLLLEENLPHFFSEPPKALIIDGYSVFPFSTLEDLSSETKLIFINRFEGPERYEASYILYDYKMAGYVAAKKLLEIGKKKIMILSFEIQPGWTSDLFFQGCEKAFDEEGVQDFIYVDEVHVPAGETEAIFKRQLPDGIISFGDSKVLPLIGVIREEGLKVPEDVAIVGFQNSPWAEAYDLTSISLQPEVMVEKAGECVESEDVKEISVQPEIVFRGSCPAGKEGGR